MKNFKLIKTITEIVSIVSGILLIVAQSLSNVFGNLSNYPTYWIILGVIAIVLIASFVGLLISVSVIYNIQRSSTSNTAIIKRSHAICKKILKLSKQTDRKIKKEMTISEKHMEKNDFANTAKAISSLSDKPKDISQHKLAFFDKISYAKMANYVKRQPIDKLSNINNLIIESILKLERPLLMVEQYSMRIDFGEYLLSHSCDIKNHEKAYIDYIGWTYSLLGNHNKFLKNVNKGIELLEKHIEVASSNEDYTEAERMLARAYRHLGSDVEMYTKHPLEAIEYLNKSNGILLELYSDREKLEKDSLYVGVQYGLAIAKINAYLQKARRAEVNIDTVQYLVDARKIINSCQETSKNFEGKHRYLKFLTLENTLLEEVSLKLDNCDDKVTKMFFDAFGNINGNDKNKFKDDLLLEFKDNLKNIEKLLENNIYADEAIELYFDQEVKHLYRNIKRIAQRGE